MTTSFFGSIPFRYVGDQLQVVMVQNKNYEWSFPKGGDDKGETSAIQTIIKELREETSLRIVTWHDPTPLRMEYTDKGVNKVVYLFIVTVNDATPRPDRTVPHNDAINARWVHIDWEPNRLTGGTMGSETRRIRALLPKMLRPQ